MSAIVFEQMIEKTHNYKAAFIEQSHRSRNRNLERNKKKDTKIVKKVFEFIQAKLLLIVPGEILIEMSLGIFFIQCKNI